LTAENIFLYFDSLSNSSSKKVKPDNSQCSLAEAPPPKVEFHVTGVDRFSVDSIQLTVVPDPLYEVIINNEFYGQLAFFGLPFGKSLIAPAVISDPLDGCSFSKLKDNNFEGNIVVMKRGNCLFSDKVMNAQNKNALAVIIYNSENDEVFLMGNNKDADLYRDIIQIPSMMVTRSAGLSLMSLIKSTQLSTISIAPLIRDPSIVANSSLQLTLTTRQGGISRTSNISWAHSYAFVHEDSIIFSLDSLGIDYNNQNMELMFYPATEEKDFYRFSPIRSNERIKLPQSNKAMNPVK